MQNNGIRVPEDISIICGGKYKNGTQADLKLTIIDNQLKGIFKSGLDILHDIIKKHNKNKGGIKLLTPKIVDWYKKALRKDGGFIRGTYSDFNTNSFGHATSGTACAVICFLKYYEHSKDEKIIEYIERGLDYCMKMQFTNPDDPNLQGTILEKVIYPEGTDHSPYYIRDLGTIFFIQAASMYLQIFDH